MLGIDTQ